MSDILTVAMDAIVVTLVLALAAFGLAIIYGLVGVINMAHGAMLTLGAYIAWTATSHGLPFAVAVLAAGFVVGLIGLVLEHGIIRHFYDRPFDTLLLTWAFFLIITELIKIVFGTDFRNVPSPFPGAIVLGTIKFPAYRTFIAGLSLVLMISTAILLYRTSLGIKIRALIQNREVASLLGLNINRTYKTVFGLGSFIAGISGALIAPMLSVDPYIGNVYLVRSFFVVIVGGIGQILAGTLVGSFLIGGAETLFSIFSSQVVAQAAVFFLAIVILRFRPEGVIRSR
jgi:urea transport system permease protein